jgi:hypothetical protein
MPLGIVTDNEFDQEFNEVVNTPKDNVIIPEVIIENMNRPGRHEGDVNVPDEVRKFIAESAILGTPAREVAALMNISEGSVKAYKNGTTSLATYNDKKPELVNHITKVKDRISRRARKVLVNSLDSLTDINYDTIKPKDRAQIARTMSAIVKEMEPEDSAPINDNRVQIVMFAPAIKQERAYDAIDVSSLDGE